MGLREVAVAGALGLAALAAGAHAQEACNTTIAETATSVPDLSDLVATVQSVAGDEALAAQAGVFLSAVTDKNATVTAFAPVNAAFAPLANVTFNAAEVLMFHAVPGMMEAGTAYDTAAGPDAGQLTINGETVEGPCNTANVAQTVPVCGSIVHVIDAVLLPAEFCAEDDHDDHDDHNGHGDHDGHDDRDDQDDHDDDGDENEGEDEDESEDEEAAATPGPVTEAAVEAAVETAVEVDVGIDEFGFLN